MKKTKKFVCPEITERIKAIVGADKKAFAKKSEISYEVIRLWCNGEYLPTVEFLLKLKKLNINIDWLLTGKTERNNYKEENKEAHDIVEYILNSEKSEAINALHSGIKGVKALLSKDETNKLLMELVAEVKQLKQIGGPGVAEVPPLRRPHKAK